MEKKPEQSKLGCGGLARYEQPSAEGLNTCRKIPLDEYLRAP